MCGILGIVCPEGRLTPAALAPGLAALAHRGPDGRGAWAASHGQAALGHTRLAVMAVEDGQQPISDEDGVIWAVVNGELYGAQALRLQLRARGHRFKTGSDSELLIHLYQERGAAAVEALRGEFAALLWDDRQRLLYAWRDRFGVKPLCWAQAPDGRLLLASEAKALFASGLPARWDAEALLQSAQLHYGLPASTLFEGVQQVPPGHLLIASPTRSPQLRRYWDWDYPTLAPQAPRPAQDETTPPCGSDEPQAIARVRQALEQAVALRLEADVEVGCYLSGGLDSCAVLGLAQRHSDRPLRAFTLSFEEAAYDEAPIAQRQADHVGASLQIVRVSRLDALEALGQAVWHAEGLAINGHLSAKLLLSRATRQAGVKAVLVGEGADELFAGYPHLRRDLGTFAGQPLTPGALDAPSALAQGVFLAPEGAPSLPLERAKRTLGFMPAFLEAKATLGHRVMALLHPDLLARWPERDAYQVALDHLDMGQLQGRHPVHQSLYVWSKLALANYILRMIGDATELAHGVEGRLPYLDHPLVELAASLPVDLKLRGHVEKYILREATRDVLTDEVYRRPKHALLAPPSRSEAATALIQDTLRSQSFMELPYFDAGRVLAMLDGLSAMDAAARTHVDPVLTLLLSAHALHVGFKLEVT